MRSRPKKFLNGWACNLYRLLLHSNIEKQLSKIPQPYAERIAQTIRTLKNEPRPPQSRQLVQDIYRLREGEYRIIYVIFDSEQTVYIGKIARRSEKVYRNVASILAAARRIMENITE